MIEPCVRVRCDGKACHTEPLLFDGALVPAGELTAAGWMSVRPPPKEREPGAGQPESGRTEHFCPNCQE